MTDEFILSVEDSYTGDKRIVYKGPDGKKVAKIYREYLLNLGHFEVTLFKNGKEMPHINTLMDCMEQHIKYYMEGCSDCLRTLKFGEKDIWDVCKVDINRYSPGSAKRISYDEGWNYVLNTFDQGF